jgi:hypothetical protein
MTTQQSLLLLDNVIAENTTLAPVRLAEEVLKVSCFIFNIKSKG